MDREFNRVLFELEYLLKNNSKIIDHLNEEVIFKKGNKLKTRKTTSLENVNYVTKFWYYLYLLSVNSSKVNFVYKLWKKTKDYYHLRLTKSTRYSCPTSPLSPPVLASLNLTVINQDTLKTTQTASSKANCTSGRSESTTSSSSFRPSKSSPASFM